MNQKKKLVILGLIAAIFGYSIASAAVGGSAYAPIQQRALDENRIHTPYFQQRDPYYCGQASIQMILYAIEGVPVSQYSLERETGFIEGAGTRSIDMLRPFEKRGIQVLSCGPFSNKEYLRRGVDNGQYSIISIRFDAESSVSHYVVVVGYNASGFFLNDPWPEEWKEPVGRHSGKDVYVSNELLDSLWGYRLNWVLSVAGPNSVVASVEAIQECS
jgi:hypothetical protein